MNFLVDECCARAVIWGLRADGHFVNSVSESMRGRADSMLMSIAVEEEQILITEDRDFGDLVFRDGAATRGVILLRLGDATPEEKLGRLRAFLANHESRLVGSFAVLSLGKDRIRSLSGETTPPKPAGTD